MAGTGPVSAPHAALQDQPPESQQIWGRGGYFAYSIWDLGVGVKESNTKTFISKGYQVLLLNSRKGNLTKMLWKHQPPELWTRHGTDLASRGARRLRCNVGK